MSDKHVFVLDSDDTMSRSIAGYWGIDVDVLQSTSANEYNDWSVINDRLRNHEVALALINIDTFRKAPLFNLIEEAGVPIIGYSFEDDPSAKFEGWRTRYSMPIIDANRMAGKIYVPKQLEVLELELLMDSGVFPEELVGVLDSEGIYHDLFIPAAGPERYASTHDIITKHEGIELIQKAFPGIITRSYNNGEVIIPIIETLYKFLPDCQKGPVGLYQENPFRLIETTQILIRDA